MRLQKFLSASGYCSRREAEKLIEEGRVTIDGKTARIGESVDEKINVVHVDDSVITYSDSYTYIMLNKPKGYVTTMHDEFDRPIISDLVKEVHKRIYPVGRLDFASEGLIIMTDDGETANCLMHPAYAIKKTYLVDVWGKNIPDAVEHMKAPVRFQNEIYFPAKVDLVKSNGKNAVLEITICEGKNHEIRNICAALGLKVDRLKRIRQGELELKNLPTGKWRYLTTQEIGYLRNLHQFAQK